MVDMDATCANTYQETKVCGHTRGDHRKVHGKATLICFSAEPCGCQRFVRAKKGRPTQGQGDEPKGSQE